MSRIPRPREHSSRKTINLGQEPVRLRVLRVFLRRGTSFGGHRLAISAISCEFVERSAWLRTKEPLRPTSCACHSCRDRREQNPGITSAYARGLSRGACAHGRLHATSAVAMIIYGYGVSGCRRFADSGLAGTASRCSSGGGCRSGCMGTWRGICVPPRTRHDRLIGVAMVALAMRTDPGQNR